MPQDNKPDSKKPLGENIRDTVNKALSAECRHEVQLAIIDQIFFDIAERLPRRMEKDLSDFFNQAASVPDSMRPQIEVELLTMPPGDQGGGYSPVKRFSLGINPTFTEFDMDDVVALPGYIRLHEVARDMDVAIQIMNLSKEEVQGAGDFPSPPMLIVNGMKSYEEGAFEHPMQHPNLPPKPLKADRMLPPPPPQKPKKDGGKDLDF